MEAERHRQESEALNDMIMREYGVSIPRICMIIRKHRRYDLSKKGIVNAARAIADDSHLLNTIPTGATCTVCIDVASEETVPTAAHTLEGTQTSAAVMPQTATADRRTGNEAAIV